jgi:toxin-antitoxin system PIN domain toxin
MLLDVNVLLALSWPNHQFHAPAVRWFLGRGDAVWATCTVTQLGFIRISSHRKFTPDARSPAEAAELLRLLTERSGHEFLGEETPPALLDEEWAHAIGPKQVTDVYLVCLATRHKMELASFDARLGNHTGVGGRVHLLTPDSH